MSGFWLKMTSFERNLVHVEIRVKILVDLAFRLVEMGKMIIKTF